VVATAAPSPTYQWYEGQSGDTSIPIGGATSASYITPQLTVNTSYWVQVSNGVGAAANSATATITINLTCTLVVQGAGAPAPSNPLSITATATCTDVPGQSFTTLIYWGDGTPPATGTGSLTASHTYSGYPAAGYYVVSAQATATSGITTTTVSPVSLVQPQEVTGVFPGQTSEIEASLSTPGKGNLDVTFECTTITDSSGNVSQASALGIECGSIPSPVLLTSKPQQVTITIGTTGPATGTVGSMSKRAHWPVAIWLPLAALVLFGTGWRRPQRHRGGPAMWLTGGVLVILVLLFTSCGGGFNSPAVTETATPAGSYQVTVVSQPASGQSTTGFVQTSLIVPLSVSPTP
jgi:Ig-like domain CHU_C associated